MIFLTNNYNSTCVYNGSPQGGSTPAAKTVTKEEEERDVSQDVPRAPGGVDSFRIKLLTNWIIHTSNDWRQKREYIHDQVFVEGAFKENIC